MCKGGGALLYFLARGTIITSNFRHAPCYIIAILGGSRFFRKRKDAPLRNSSRSLGWLCLPDSLPFSKPKFNWLFHLQLATNLPKTHKYASKFIFLSKSFAQLIIL